MQAEIQRFADRWSEFAVEGQVIQIRGESILFRPRAATRGFWLFLEGQRPMPPIGPVRVIVNPAVFDCKRIIPRRGAAVKTPVIEQRKDELERLVGKLARYDGDGRNFVLNIGFPVVISLLEECREIRRARPGEILELELAPPALGHLVA